jgi:sterol 3beta-glucosyltransferase
MRWSPVSWRRSKDTGLRPSSASSSDTPHDEPKSPQSQDPGFARLFSDAALFDKILTSSPDLREGGSTAESKSANDNLAGFSQLVARDLDDNERAVSEKFAQITVSNWSAGGAPTLAPGADPGQSDESASEDEHDKISPDGVKEAGEPDFEAKLDPVEIVGLVEQEFGALAPKGEEKLLLESDATFFQDVVILVRFASRDTQLWYSLL